MKTLYLGIAAFLVSTATSVAVAASQYPERPVKIIAPLPAGSATDTVARILASSLEQAMGQPFIIENRAGADGLISAQAAARAEPDGYTLYFATNSPMSAVPALKKSPGYDPVDDFTPISLVGRYSQLIWVNASSPFTTLDELVQYAKQKPGELNYGTGNTGGIVSLYQWLNLAGDLQLVHVPYTGEPAAVTDLLGERIQVAIATPTVAGPHATAGTLRPLAVTLQERSSAYPDVPTLSEAGYPDFSITLWGGLFAPAGMNPDLANRLAQEVERALAKPEVREQLARQQFFPESSTPQALGEFVSTQLHTYREVLQAAGVHPD